MIFVLIAALCWAADAIFFRYTLESADFVQSLAMKMVIISAGAFIFLYFRDRRQLLLKKSESIVLVWITLLSLVAGDLIAYFALTKIPILNFIVIGHIQPLFMLLLTFIILKHEKSLLLDYVGGIILFLSAIIVSAGALGNLANLDFGSPYNFLMFVPVIF